MLSDKLFIPKKIKSGFVNREDTYTKKLAYVIYYDQKNVLRKQTSWENWRDKTIPEIDYDNEPVEGFVLNKGVGGQKHSYGWNARNEYIRIYDPRDFEFEISVENLLFILKECDCSRGKGLEGKFVYAWDGKELVLLPVSSQDYQESKSFTKLQSQKVSVKDLVPGHTYLSKGKRQKKLVYVGRYKKYLPINTDANSWTVCDGRCVKDVKKSSSYHHVFFNEYEMYGKTYQEMIYYKDASNIADRLSEFPVSNLAEMIDRHYNSIYGTKVMELKSRKANAPAKNTHGYLNHTADYTSFFQDEYHVLQNHYNCHSNNKLRKSVFQSNFKVEIVDGILTFSKPKKIHTVDIDENSNTETLWAVLESGKEFKIKKGYME